MTTITTRSGKGSPLTNDEMDANLTSLNDDKVEASGDSMTGDLSFGDNDKAIFGAGSDLQIYHDGNNSFIDDQGTGALVIQSNGAFTLIQNSSGVANARFDSAGAASLRYNGAEKLATTSTGIDVTGTVTADGLTLQTSEDVISWASGNGIVQAPSNLYVRSSGTGDVLLQSDSTAVAKFEHGGDISFYDSSGTSQSLFWDASAESLGIGTDSPSSSLTTKADSGVLVTDASGLRQIEIVPPQTSNSFVGVMGTRSSHPLVFNTVNAERMRIDSSGTLITKGAAVFNEDSADADFRVESDTNTHALFVDAGNSRVGVNVSTPIVPFSVAGSPDTDYGVANFAAGIAGEETFLTLSRDGSQAGGFKVLRGTTPDLRLYVQSDESSVLNYNGGNTGDSLFIVQGAGTGALVATFDSGNNIIFNDNSGDQDFRVESNSNTHAIFVNAGADGVGFGATASTVGSSTIEGMYYEIGGSLTVASNTETLQINRNNTGGNNRTNIGLYNNGIIRGIIGTLGGQDGIYLHSGGNVDNLVLKDDETVFNESGADIDFRVESDTLTHALFVDAGSNAIGINNSAPSGVKLSVHGQTTAAVAWGDTSDRGFLSFDGSGNPVVRANSGLGLKLQANASTDIATFGDPAANYSIVFNDNGSPSIDFRVESDSNSYSFFVDASTDRVGMGTSIPAAPLEIIKATPASDTMISLRNSAYGSTDSSGETKIAFGWSNHFAANIAAYKQTTNRTGFKFYTELGYNTENLALTLDVDGNLFAKGGIYLGGETATANRLDDYEEGTWTPVITGGATSITYTEQTGTYTKVGRIVQLRGIIKGTWTTTGGVHTFGGLPFTSNSGGTWAAAGVGSFYDTTLNRYFSVVPASGSSWYVVSTAGVRTALSTASTEQTAVEIMFFYEAA